MIDMVGAARIDESSRPVDIPFGFDLILEGRIEYLDDPADKG